MMCLKNKVTLLTYIIIYSLSCSQLKNVQIINYTCYYIGIMQLIDHFDLNNDSESISTVTPASQCRKDLGDKRKLRHWSRGHVFVVRSCGHIDTWKPIYKYFAKYKGISF